MNARPHAAIALLVLALTGCSGPNPEIPPPGSSPSFSSGYISGCKKGEYDANPSAYDKLGGYGVDRDRYQTDIDYRNGWLKGRLTCYNAAHAVPRVSPGV